MTKNVEETTVQPETVAVDIARTQAEPPEADRTLLDDKEGRQKTQRPTLVLPACQVGRGEGDHEEHRADRITDHAVKEKRGHAHRGQPQIHQNQGYDFEQHREAR